MKTLRNQMLAKLHILLQQQGGIDYKMALYSSYGVESARDMSDAQLSDAIARLDGDASYKAPVAIDPIKALRSDALCIMTRSASARTPTKRGLSIPNDWSAINPFVEFHAGKLLYQMDELELCAFIKKLYAIRKSGWFYRPKQHNAATVDKPATVSQRPTVSITIPMTHTSTLLS